MARAIGWPVIEADQEARDSGPRRSVSEVNSHRPLGIAQSSRPPSTDSGESTQMSVISTARPGPVAGRATSTSEEVTLALLAERLLEFTDTHPEFETPVERFATWLARLDDPED